MMSLSFVQMNGKTSLASSWNNTLDLLNWNEMGFSIVLWRFKIDQCNKKKKKKN